MKRRFTILTAAFMLLAFLAIPMGMIGQTNLQFAPDQATTGSTSTSYVGTETTFTTQEVTFVINNWNPSSLQIRGNQTTQSNLQSGANFYLHNTTAMPGNITGITITYTAGAIVNTKTYATTNSSAITNQTISGSIAGTAETNSVSWTFDGTSPFFAIGMEKGGTSGTTKCGTITVTYTTGGSDTPSISANNIEIVFDATSGDIEYTINNPVEGGVLTANTEAEWLTIGTVGEETVAFTCTENDGDIRTANVTLTYTYGDNETVSKDVTVTQAAAPVIYSTIPALFAAATSTETNVLVTFNNWVVSGVSTNGKNVFVTDNNGNGFVIFNNNGGLDQTYSVGNILSGTAVSCTLKKYNGFAELLNVDANDLTITTGGTITVANVDMADLAGVNTGALLHYDNLTCSVNNNKYYLSDGTTTLQVYNALYAFDALEDGETYNITGIYQQYNSTKEILPRSAEDIEKVVMASVTVTPNTINAPAEGTDGTLSLTYENITDFISFDYYFCDSIGEALEEDPDWIYAEINEENDVYTLDYLIDANNGEARTAYIKVYTYDDELEEVYAIVTVNQAAAPQQYTLTVEPFENLEIITFVNDEMVMEGDGTINVMEGDIIMLSIVADPGYVMETLMVNNMNHVNDIADDFTYTFEMPAENVTISATAVENIAPVGGNYVRITSLDQLTDGSKVIIAARYDEDHPNGYYAMPGQTSGKPVGVAFTSETSGNDEILPATITASEDTYYWTVNVTEDGYTFMNAEDYYIGYPNSGTNFSTGGYNTAWTINRETAAQTAMVAEYTGFVIRNGNTNTRAFAFNGTAFGAYATSNMTGSGYNFFLDFFVQTEAVETETYPLDIAGYQAGSTGGYYLIASPVTVDPATVDGMTEGTFDLYYFDQAEDLEWRNYETQPFNLVPGKGYLYAKQATTEGEIFHFELTGTPYNNQPITLSKTNGGDFPGWNLVGNPFGQTAYIDRDFYVMKDDGTEIITGEGNEIGVMQGVFVIATQDGEEMTFSTEAPGTTGEKLVMNVSRNRGNVVDRAIVRFGQGGVLPKFQLNENSTKLYIVEGENEYAVVRSANEGEMPVSFKASENGNYTLSVNAENVEMEYLHLIDNMTGADIDLLQTPSYNFETIITDNANRFALVYATTTSVNENSTEHFAFFNGNSWVINNEGEATLQVIDMTGRVLSNEQINGSYNNSLNLSAGVYVLRLSNGNTVKTQKVVVD